MGFKQTMQIHKSPDIELTQLQVPEASVPERKAMQKNHKKWLEEYLRYIYILYTYIYI